MNPAEKFLRHVAKGDAEMPICPLQHSGVINSADLWDAFKIYKELHDYHYAGHMGSFFSKAEKIFNTPRIEMNLPRDSTGRRGKFRGYVLDGSLSSRSPQELVELGKVFGECVDKNNIPSPGSRIEGLNT